MTPSLAFERKLHCSFCGKSADEVRKLIAGPMTFICDECVGVCQAILAGEPAPVAPALSPAQEAVVRDIVAQMLASTLADVDRRLRDAITTAAQHGETSR